MHLERGQAYLKDPKLNEAAIEFKNVLQIVPRDVQGHYQLASTYLWLGDPLTSNRLTRSAIRFFNWTLLWSIPISCWPTALRGKRRRQCDPVDLHFWGLRFDRLRSSKGTRSFFWEGCAIWVYFHSIILSLRGLKSAHKANSPNQKMIQCTTRACIILNYIDFFGNAGSSYLIF